MSSNHKTNHGGLSGKPVDHQKNAAALTRQELARLLWACRGSRWDETTKRLVRSAHAAGLSGFRAKDRELSAAGKNWLNGLARYQSIQMHSATRPKVVMAKVARMACQFITIPELKASIYQA